MEDQPISNVLPQKTILSDLELEEENLFSSSSETNNRFGDVKEEYKSLKSPNTKESCVNVMNNDKQSTNNICASHTVSCDVDPKDLCLTEPSESCYQTFQLQGINEERERKDSDSGSNHSINLSNALTSTGLSNPKEKIDELFLLEKKNCDGISPVANSAETKNVVQTESHTNSPQSVATLNENVTSLRKDFPVDENVQREKTSQCQINTEESESVSKIKRTKFIHQGLDSACGLDFDNSYRDLKENQHCLIYDIEEYGDKDKSMTHSNICERDVSAPNDESVKDRSKDTSVKSDEEGDKTNSDNDVTLCESENVNDLSSVGKEEDRILSSMSPAPQRKDFYKNDVIKSESNIATSFSCTKENDPFTLSGDEEFSPKAYKPIKRKQPGLHVSDECCTLNSKEEECGMEKRRKLIEKDSQVLDKCSSSSSSKPVSVNYVYSKELVEKANKLIRIEGRANLVHSLIEVYGILQHVNVIPPRLATKTEILGFHCPMYIDFLQGLTDCDDPSDSVNDEAETYGLSYDCPLQEELFETASLISGATIEAAQSLVDGTAIIAANWCGGWHHAKRDSASGFCYINDIALGILKLREKFDKVLYVDLDLHHGDGVEEAFYMTPKVMTVSFHKYACGFFPGTGSLSDVGSGRGRLYTVNVPLLDGVRDGQFYHVFTSVMKKVRETFGGEAVVIQCGSDGLSEDPMSSFNLTHVAIAKCVCFLLTWKLPTLLLGGGGYNFPNTAKCWTFLTAMAAGKKLPLDIPEHEHLLEYGPSYELTTSPGNRKDCNTQDHLQHVLDTVHKNLNCL